VAWIADRSTVSWALFRQTSQWTTAMVSDEPHSLVSLQQPHAVAVNLGDYEGSGLAELALGIVDDNEITLYLYAIDELSLVADGLPMALKKTLPIGKAPWWDTAQYKYACHPLSSTSHGRRSCHLTNAPRTRHTHHTHTACGWCRAT
jgi:hypothetical protein